MNAGVAQLVEHNLAKVDVAGSSPVSRSKSTPVDFFIYKQNIVYIAKVFSGGVAKWSKAKVCKTFIHRFESDRRLFYKTSQSEVLLF